jgi:hypothetical protein
VKTRLALLTHRHLSTAYMCKIHEADAVLSEDADILVFLAVAGCRDIPLLTYVWVRVIDRLWWLETPLLTKWLVDFYL